jgi:hypothetical protein
MSPVGFVAGKFTAGTDFFLTSVYCSDTPIHMHVIYIIAIQNTCNVPTFTSYYLTFQKVSAQSSSYIGKPTFESITNEMLG